MWDPESTGSAVFYILLSSVQRKHLIKNESKVAADHLIILIFVCITGLFFCFPSENCSFAEQFSEWDTSWVPFERKEAAFL